MPESINISEDIFIALIGSGGIIIGALISSFSQYLYFHFIEKGKLKAEREFSFQKEYYFELQKNAQKILSKIEQDYIDMSMSLPYQNLYYKENKIIEISSIEIVSMVKIYFPQLLKDYTNLSIHLGNMILFINQGEFNNQDEPSEEFNNELQKFEKLKNSIQDQLLTHINNHTPVKL